MSNNLSYGLKKTLDMSMDDAEARVREALVGEGFGVLTEIDVQATFKAKLNVDFRPYKILGAYNPPLAHQALNTELDIGLFSKGALSVSSPRLSLSTVSPARTKPSPTTVA